MQGMAAMDWCGHLGAPSTVGGRCCLYAPFGIEASRNWRRSGIHAREPISELTPMTGKPGGITGNRAVRAGVAALERAILTKNQQLRAGSERCLGCLAGINACRCCPAGPRDHWTQVTSRPREGLARQGRCRWTSNVHPTWTRGLSPSSRRVAPGRIPPEIEGRLPLSDLTTSSGMPQMTSS